MKNLISAILLLVLLSAVSCSKDETIISPAQTVDASVSSAVEPVLQMAGISAVSQPDVIAKAENDTVIIGSCQYTYDSNVGGYTVSASNVDDSIIILPQVNGMPVVVIEDGGFEGHTELYDILIIPSSIRKIGKRAFAGCTGLVGDLFIPDSVEQIGESAFENCIGLDGVLYIGKGLKEIPSRCFSGCISFTGELLIPENIRKINSKAFLKCRWIEDEIIFAGSQVAVEADAFE
ncbi:MAG: leucine-rich repeat domain-containing protein [Bullifex sp.]|nr:leucine-rich repeat domain-containing protein [Bullifex sp.]